MRTGGDGKGQEMPGGDWKGLERFFIRHHLFFNGREWIGRDWRGSESGGEWRRGKVSYYR